MNVQTPEQRASALKKANETRYARAQLRRQLEVTSPADARRWVAGLLVDPPEFLLGLATAKLLAFIPRVGVKVSTRWLTGADIRNGLRPVGALTERQRAGLAALIAGEVPTRVPEIASVPYTRRRQMGTNVTPDVYDAFERRAAEHNTTVAGELRDLVHRSLNGRAA